MLNNSLNNIIDNSEIGMFRNTKYSYSVSGRYLYNNINVDIIDQLKLIFHYIDISQIRDVYGSSIIKSDLYGGRNYVKEGSFTDEQVNNLKDNNINISLTLSNHFFNKDIYKDNIKLLEKYHNSGNGIICTDDELAKLIRNDFPLYKIKASLLRNVVNLEEIKRCLDIYDEIVLPTSFIL